jgi:hypothetical protein
MRPVSCQRTRVARPAIVVTSARAADLAVDAGSSPWAGCTGAERDEARKHQCDREVICAPIGCRSLPVARPVLSPTGWRRGRAGTGCRTRRAVRRCFDDLAERGLHDLRSVLAVVEVIRSARLGRCLVLQPHRPADEKLYTSTLRPAIEEEMIPVRLKDAAGSQQIYGSFFEAISYCTAIIADITELNENVMYEVGYAPRAVIFSLCCSLPTRRGSSPYRSTCARSTSMPRLCRISRS